MHKAAADDCSHLQILLKPAARRRKDYWRVNFTFTRFTFGMYKTRKGRELRSCVYRSRKTSYRYFTPDVKHASDAIPWNTLWRIYNYHCFPLYTGSRVNGSSRVLLRNVYVGIYASISL